MEKEIRCPNCNRYNGTAYGTVVMRTICKNSSCGMRFNVKMASGDSSADMRYAFKEANMLPKKPQTTT